MTNLNEAAMKVLKAAERDCWNAMEIKVRGLEKQARPLVPEWRAYKALQDAQLSMAIACGGRDRFKVAQKLDPDYFNDNMEDMYVESFWNEEGLTYGLATWMFDQIGRASRNWILADTEEAKGQNQRDGEALLKQMQATIGFDLANAAFRNWIEGRHDT